MSKTDTEELRAKIEKRKATTLFLRDVVVRGLTNWVPGEPIPLEVVDAYEKLLEKASEMQEAEEVLDNQNDRA